MSPSPGVGHRLRERAKAAVPVVNRLTERLGVRLQPVHYYSEVPDRRRLRSERASWARPAGLHGVHWDLDEQLRWLEKVCLPHRDEVAGL